LRKNQRETLARWKKLTGSIQRVCRVMNISRNSFYDKTRSQSPLRRKMEAELFFRIGAICMEFPGFGYRKVTKQLQRDGWRTNHKRGTALDEREGPFMSD
jgi:hypothetical protein